jgi:DNA invertase Pin-like site-specific DNA recombinase
VNQQPVHEVPELAHVVGPGVIAQPVLSRHAEAAELRPVGIHEATHLVGIVEKGAYLLVESLDRVSRDTAYDAQLTLQNIIKRVVTVVTLMDGRAYSREALREDPLGILYALMVFMRANEESKTKSRRLKAAWHGKRLRVRDKTMTKMTPGWIALDADRKPVLIEERAKFVCRIVKDYLRGVGKDAIAKALNVEKVPTFGRAKHWHASYMAKILSSPALVGTFVPHVDDYKDGKRRRTPLEPVAGYYPAVIDHDTFERVQSLLGRSPLRRRHTRHP